jgi:hypothetical protein
MAWGLAPDVQASEETTASPCQTKADRDGISSRLRPAASTTCPTSIACIVREQRIRLLDRVRIPAQHTWRSARSQRRTLEFTLRFGQIRIGYSEVKYKHDKESNSGVLPVGL